MPPKRNTGAERAASATTCADVWARFGFCLPSLGWDIFGFLDPPYFGPLQPNHGPMPTEFERVRQTLTRLWPAFARTRPNPGDLDQDRFQFGQFGPDLGQISLGCGRLRPTLAWNRPTVVELDRNWLPVSARRLGGACLGGDALYTMSARGIAHCRPEVRPARNSPRSRGSLLGLGRYYVVPVPNFATMSILEVPIRSAGSGPQLQSRLRGEHLRQKRMRFQSQSLRYSVRSTIRLIELWAGRWRPS